MTEQTTAEDIQPRTDQPRRQWWRAPAAVVAAFAILWGAASLTTGGFILWGFGGIVGLPLIAGALVGAAALLVVVGVALTGQRRIGGSVVAVGAMAVMLAAAVTHFGEIPMLWWATGGVDLVYPLVAAGAALVWGACVGGWPMRAAGIAAGLAMVVVAGAVFDIREEPDPETLPPTKEEALARYLEEQAANWSTDVPGATLAQASVYNGPTSVIVTAEGGVVVVRQDFDPPSEENADRYPCWMIADPNPGIVDPHDGNNTLTAEDYSATCAVDDDGAHRIDGLGYSRREGSGYLIVTSEYADVVHTYDDGTVSPAGAKHAGTPDEVAAVLEGLRPINDEELRRLFEENWAFYEANPER
ncbi:hypothetical protein [Demequina sp. NBRC 110057]|uniref:hypothetical protein n=1 Tax=Demequina sp. NBRC 110057 TaxID=1570346 RepID=UPI0009FF5DB7|nr:hypothetical protein [Demequina sp. NBRC 110057]